MKVLIENTYSDGHESSHTLDVADEPTPEALDDWWEEVVWPHTGDGYGDTRNVDAYYTATVLAAHDPRLVDETRDWD